MNATEAARREAERIYQTAVAAGDDPWQLLEFVKREAMRRDLDVYALQPGDSQLKGGRAAFDSQAGIILYEDAGTEFERAFLIAHELGHVVLERGVQDIVTEQIEPDRSIEDAPVGVEKVIDYGVRERREIRMDIFARELLLPRSVVRDLHVNAGLSSNDIAKRLAAPLSVVQQQLLDSLLLPIEDSATETYATNSSEALIPDPTQIIASEHRNSPFQLQAGPGTGKTRTLVRRIENLIAEGVNPMSILVLTFSNKAANELSERLVANNPTAAAAMWIGTFHAFGLDIIRRFHDKLVLPPDPRLLDRSEAIELLEDELPRLPLRHYRNLWDPALDLSDMLSAISRAKDEVVDAATYRSLAQAMANNHQDAEAAIRAEKCLEVALLFETYEHLMVSKQLIDFGDLVALPVRLVEADSEVREALRSRHQHVLVDEYQDVNRASVRLLKAIVGEGRNLWVVGDARQSIYRFRGASATNMAQFSVDFPGAKVCQLGVNYRSVQKVVDTFTAFSSTMKASAGALPLQLTVSRCTTDEDPEFRVVGSTDDEISALAAVIQAQCDAGIRYRKQALLCASNARLSEIAEGLEARGIPVLHLGSLFERSEIKDLLALVSMLTDPHAVGLIRVTTIPEYEMPLQDVLQIVAYLKEIDPPPLKWWQAVTNLPSLKAESQAVLVRIANLFDGLNQMDNPWMILTTWVIDGLGLAKGVYLARDPQSRMKGLALWQFLNFCRCQSSGAGIPSLRLLDRIRRLVLISEDRSLRQLPAVAEGIDAVRLLTIHASKGLEFDTVHIPGMVTSGLPRNNIAPRCVPPDGLIHGSLGFTGLEAVKSGHDEEEECLFFVALSRARDRLFLYASSLQNGGRTRNPSKFIAPIDYLLLRPHHISYRQGKSTASSGIEIDWEEKPTWTDNQFSLFERCPRRFLYTHVLKLGGRRTETAFMKMHNVVSDVFDWLKTVHETSNPSVVEVNKRFEEAWQAKGTVEHGYAEDYRRIGRRLIDYLIEITNIGVPFSVQPINLSVGEGGILVRPDSVSEEENGRVVVRRVKTGKPRSNAFDDIEYTILHLAAEQAFGGRARVEVSYLTSETTEQMSISLRKLTTRKQKIGEIIQNVRSGDFPTNLEARTCPRCPSFFICGKLPSGPIKIKI